MARLHIEHSLPFIRKFRGKKNGFIIVLNIQWDIGITRTIIRNFLISLQKIMELSHPVCGGRSQPVRSVRKELTACCIITIIQCLKHYKKIIPVSTGVFVEVVRYPMATRVVPKPSQVHEYILGR